MLKQSIFQCPEGCSCFHDSQWTVNTIQCSNRGHTDVPALIPMDATEVFLDGNNMTELVNPGFIGRRRIRSVFLNSSMIRMVTNFSLEGLTDVRVLHLEDNQIELLSGNEFTGLTSLKELYLHNNYITTIGSGTFSTLRSLSVLRLDGNLLSSFPVLELVANPMLVGLYMAGNVWSCDCDFLQPFLALQRRLGSKIIDRNDLKCISSNFRNEAITSMESVPCANEDPLVDADFQASKVSQLDYTPILVSVLLAVLMIVVGYLLAFTFRSSIKEWLYRQTKGTTAGKATSVYNDKDKLFDVFISYSVEDRDFVEQSFAPNLEHGATSYRLCLHQRDFPPTTPVFDTVSVAVESSARALVVLSRPYLSSQWSQIRAPFISSIMANNSKVVFIQLEEVGEAEVNQFPDLKHLMDDSPLVKWGDPGFWNKLRYFLPEPVYLTFHRNVTMRGTLQSSNLYQAVASAQPLPPFPPGQAEVAGKCSHATQQQGVPPIYSLDHTYHSIDNNHIYHTLDPGGGSSSNLYLQYQPATQQHQQLPNRVYINADLQVTPLQPVPSFHPGLQRALPAPQPSNHPGSQQQQQSTRSTPEQHPINHTHSNSTSSAKRLLSPEDSEYIV